jgi:hypothetical protein
MITSLCSGADGAATATRSSGGTESDGGMIRTYLEDGPAMTEPRRSVLVEWTWKMHQEPEFPLSINARYSLGKGEVVSSILTGSTRKAHEIRAFLNAPQFHSATQHGTKRETRRSVGGILVECDHHPFTREDTMTTKEQWAEQRDHMRAMVEQRDRDGWESPEVEQWARFFLYSLEAAVKKELPPAMMDTLRKYADNLEKALAAARVNVTHP